MIRDGLLPAYRVMTRLLEPLSKPLLARRLRRGKEDAARLSERSGHASLPRPNDAPIWIHAASVGELMSVLALIEALAGSAPVLVTTGTVASAQLAQQRLPQGAFHQFVPIDTPRAARRFINHWRPRLGIFVESELWPNLIEAAARAGVALAIVNGRMSERSFATWSRFPRTIHALLSRFVLGLTQTEADAARYRALGLGAARAIGNLKFDAAPLPGAADLAPLRAHIGDRPVFLAASTHPGEDEVVLGAHLAARQSVPRLLTIIVPRHAHRGAEIEALAQAAALTVARRSSDGTLSAATSIYIADTLGELGLFYRLSSLAFIGGTIAPRGGHNPIEAGKLGVAFLHGPSTDNAHDIFAAFDAAGASVCIDDPDRLGSTVASLIDDDARRAAMSAAARQVADSGAGALQAALAALRPLGERSVP